MKRFLKVQLLVLFLTLLGFQSKSFAQTTLSPGDIAIIGTNYDVVPYEMTIVNLVPMAVGTVIRITDYGYDEATYTFGAVSVANTAEGSIEWTLTSAMPAGTVTKFSITGGTTPSVSGLPGTVNVTGWTLTNPASCPVPAGGDNWFIFQGSSPTSVSQFIFAWVNTFATLFNGVNQPAGQFLVPGTGLEPNNGNSYLPPSLTLGSTAIALNRDPANGGYHGDNNVYNGIKSGTKAAILAGICNIANWSTNETISYDISPGGAYFTGTNPIFTVTATCTAPTITANPPNRSICVNGNTTFTASATGATAFQWQVNTGSGFTDIVNGGVYSNATTNTLTITGATAGMSGYQYRCTAINGTASCFTNTNSSTLSVSNITTSQAQNNVSCFGGSNGSAAVSPSGGIGSYTYSWSPSGGTASIATGLSAGTYTVTITDAIGCQITRTFTITQPASAVSGTTVVTNIACRNGNTGAINLTPTGGTGPYTFSWAGGPTTEDRTGLTAGTYSVTITDANGCTGTVNATVTQPAAAVSGTTVVTNVACFGGNTGAINLTPTGGTGPYTFSWAGGPTTEDRTGLTAGTYSVTITDANGCTGTVNATVTQPAAAVSGTTVVTNVACFGGNTGAINLTPTGGTGPYTFSWAGGPTTEDRTGLTAGTYSVTITDANGCTGTVNATVTQPAAAVSGTTVVTNVACFGGNTGAINLTPTGGTAPYTFSWAGGPTTEDRTGLTAGTYSVTITDANGCTGTVNATVTQPAAAVSGTTVVTNVACFGGNTGAINLTPTGGTGPYTFSWAGGPTTEDRINLTAGTYSVTITDANGCTGTVNATITQPTALSLMAASQTNISCNGGSNGAASVNIATGGAGGYTYDWTPGTPTGDGTRNVTGLTAGTWTCTVTDINGCQATRTFTITQPPAISLASWSQTNVACNGGSNGVASVTPSGGAGGYTYSWSPSGGTNAIATGLAAGTYTVTVTDANSCQATRTFTITQPSAISLASWSQTNVACNGGSNGVASVTPSGGAGGYTYSWSPSGGTGATATGLAAGTYTVTVTDANSCQATRTFTITQPSAISLATWSQTNVSCNGGSNGVASVTPSGGAGGYTYSWSPSGGTGATATGLAAGTYTVTVTDANSCQATRTFTITQPTALSASTSQTNIACNGAATGVLSVSPSGGTTPYTFLWSNGNTTATVTGLVAGAYSVTVTDANACQIIRNFTITQPSALTATMSQTNASGFGISNGTATATTSGGAGGYTYSWSPSGGTGATATGLAAGTYTVTITDANLCQITRSVTITQPAGITSVSVPASGTYKIGSQLDLTVNYSSNVTVTGTPTIPLTVGSANRNANYQSGSGSSALLFRYQVVAGDEDANGIVLGSAIDLSGGASLGGAATTLANVGNTSAVLIDGIAPNTSFTSTPASLTNATSASFTFSSTEAGTFEASLDGGAYTTVTSPSTLTSLSNGSHTYMVRAIDVAGNVDVTPASYTWTVDDIAPAAPVITNPAAGTVLTGLSTVISGTAEANSSVSVTINGNNFNTAADGSGNWTLTRPLATNSYSVTAVATDAASNSSPISATRSFSVNINPTIDVAGTLTALTTTYGSASSSTNFTVSATNLTTGITAIAPTGFELSNDDITYSPTLTVGAAGNVASSTVYVRLAKEADAGGYTGNISLSSTGATAKTIATVSSTVNKRSLVVSATGINKEYDANTTATVTLGDNRITGDVLTAAYTTATFNNKNVGTGKAVSVLGISISGTDAGNYTVNTTASTTANITAKSLTITATGINKEYDASNTATVTLGDNRITGDVLTAAYTTATFNNKNVGTGKAVSVLGISISGTDAGNYTVNTTASTTANITAKSLTITATGINKEYDASNTATVTLGDNRITGDVLTAAYTTATFNNKNVGTGKAVSVSGISISGTDAGNYTVNTTASTTANITAKSLTITATGINKEYDANTIATVTLGDNRITGDVLTAAYTTATFNNKNVGTGKAVSVSGISISGTDAGNYTVNTTASTTANITAKALLVSATGINKEYDANTTATVTLGDNRITGDVLTAAYTTATFDNKNVGTGKAVSVSGISISGTDAGNYTVNTTASTTANITAKALLVSATGINKEYDANTTATVTLGDNRITGDVLTAAYTTATFNNKNVGTGKAVSVSGISISGTDAGNYTVNTTASTTANITAKSLTITATGINKEYDANTTATVTLGDNRITGDVLTAAYTTATFNNKNVGTGKAVSVSGISISGTDAGNYTVNTTASTTANITAKSLTITATGINKEYDANTTATVTLGDNRITGDVLTAAYTTATFNNKNVGTGKAVSVSGISISGTDAGNYTVNTTASTTANITAKALLVSATGINKEYDANTTATVTLGDNRITGDVLTAAYTTATFDNKNVGTGKAVSVSGISISGTDAGNYTVNTTANTTAAITRKSLTIIADNKEKFEGEANPVLTISYTGFVGGENNTVLTTQPGISTTATVSSLQGTYPITVSGAVAENYSISYQNGILTVRPGAPTSVSLAGVTFYENRPSGTLAGTLSSTSNSPVATFTYSLVAGAGDTDNASFSISGNQLRTAASLNYENKQSYSIRVRSTTQFGFSLDQIFTVNLSDVNEAPTINAINNQTICYTTAEQVIALSGITAGPEAGQTTTVTASGSNSSLLSNLSIVNNQLRYRVASGQSGTSTITVRVRDNGGVANGGVDETTINLTLVVNALPQITIVNDKGLSISKGETAVLRASGGTSYQWNNAAGIINGQNTATLTVRPLETTTYTVRVTNTNGCESVQTITIEVREDFQAIKAENFITPNGDGINDKWVVENIDVYPNHTLTIFDRAGRVLYEVRNYQNDWDGTVNGGVLSPGTYFYMFKFNDAKIAPRKGFITIVKSEQ